MSGICGIIDFSTRAVPAGDLREMAGAAPHRGPDGINSWIAENAGLANLKLNITPESRTETQPLALDEAGIVLTADARIDNRDELIRDLGPAGLLPPGQPHPPSDAMLIAAAYRRWGLDCPGRLLGDFSFAIWDQKRRRLFAARDAMGMRPFYYRKGPSRFLFASEVKQILRAPEVRAEINDTAVGMHITGLFSPLDVGFYRGIPHLLPAHALVADESACRTWRYWEIDPGFRIEYRDENQYVEHFLEIFSEAVRCRLRSFKPVGILLSGGLDSGSAASMAGSLFEKEPEKQHPEFHAFCFAFHELPQCDERHVSDEIIRRYGFRQDVVDADDAWPLKDYPEHGPDRDDPVVGHYQALLEVSMDRARSAGVGVMLSGDRGDLTMGGGIWDYSRLVRSLRIMDLKEAARAYTENTGRPVSRFLRSHLLHPLITGIWPPGRAPGLRWKVKKALGRGRFKPPDWIRPEFARRIGLQKLYEESLPNPGFRDLSRINRYQHVFSDLHMRGMVWTNRTNARFGLGFADPWSDRRLARFVLAIPQHVLNRPGEGKRLTRRAMKGIMPEEARRTAGKIYPYPFYVSSVSAKARETVYSLIRDSQAAEMGFVDPEKLLEHYERFCRGEKEHPSFWWTLALEMWLRRYWQ